MSFYNIETVVVYFVAFIGLEMVELVEDGDIPDLGEGGGLCLGEVDYDRASAPSLAGLPLHWLPS